jgi:hypothetical protein
VAHGVTLVSDWVRGVLIQQSFYDRLPSVRLHQRGMAAKSPSQDCALPRSAFTSSLSVSL